MDWGQAVISVLKGHSTSLAMANREPYEAGQEDHDRARADADNCRSSPGRLNTKQQGTGCDPGSAPGQLGIASNVVLCGLVLWVFCLHVSAPCTCTAPGAQKRALDHFGTGITDYFELTHGCWAWKSGPLQEQSVLVTMDPLLISFRADDRHTGAQFTVILQTRVNNSRCLTAWRIAHSDQGLL